MFKFFNPFPRNFGTNTPRPTRIPLPPPRGQKLPPRDFAAERAKAKREAIERMEQDAEYDKWQKRFNLGLALHGGLVLLCAVLSRDIPIFRHIGLAITFLFVVFSIICIVQMNRHRFKLPID